MSTLTKGEVAVTLAGSERTLKPSLNAFTRLSAAFKNHNVIIGRLIECDIQTIAAVLRWGLGLSDAEAKALPDLVFKTGAPSLVEPLLDYVFRLFNNGKSADEVLSEGTAEADTAGGEENPLLVG